MRKETFDLIKKEMIYVAILFFVALLLFKIAFYKESFSILLKTAASIFLLFVLPGYAIMLYWHEKLGFLQRSVMGIIIAASAAGISSYYLGILGFDTRYHAFFIPLALIASGLFAAFRRS